jgi:predicted DCC family thiol-disulfide oxidoreductase YuxK
VTVPDSTPKPRDNAVVLFDGVCNFCNGSVVFVIEHDHEGLFRFASLQSQTGRRLISEHALSQDIDTIVLIQDGVAYQRSTAALRILREFGGAWRLLGSLGLWIPRFLRDFAYALFARFRYHLFGKTEQCMVPTPELRQRFLLDTPAASTSVE